MVLFYVDTHSLTLFACLCENCFAKIIEFYSITLPHFYIHVLINWNKSVLIEFYVCHTSTDISLVPADKSINFIKENEC